jgi:hypothetical protein
MEMVVVKANGRQISWRGKTYKPDKADHLKVPKLALEELSTFGFKDPTKHDRFFTVAFEPVLEK